MRRHLGVFLVFFAIACQQQPQDYDPEERIQAIESGIRPSLVIRGEPVQTTTLAERMEHHNVPGISIAVISDGKIEWARGYGLADVAEGRPVTTSTLFQAASISKPVAATAALTLVEKGRLELDRNVNEYLVSWKMPENDFTAVQHVTLRRLVTHSAGTTVHGFPGYARSAQIPNTVEVLDGEGNTDPVRVDVEPGSRWRYSGGVDVAEKPFAEIMQEYVLGPAGMSESTYEQPLPESRWGQAATGYRSDGSEVEEKWHVYPEQAAAGLWTTPSDLARFAIELQLAYAGESDKVLSQERARAMLAPDENDWGLGPSIMEGGERFGHGGANEGFRCQLVAFIDGGRGAVIMTNSDSGGDLASEVLFNIGIVYGWSGFEVTEKVVADLNPQAYEAVVGLYDMQGTRIPLEYENGSLWAYIPGQDKVELLPESETEFFTRDGGPGITFVLEDGAVVAFEVQGTRADKIE
jgi:CubicO group peptidase (beta-lactamase class C family)